MQAETLTQTRINISNIDDDSCRDVNIVDCLVLDKFNMIYNKVVEKYKPSQLKIMKKKNAILRLDK
jgi:hypothetical protein